MSNTKNVKADDADLADLNRAASALHDRGTGYRWQPRRLRHERLGALIAAAIGLLLLVLLLSLV